MTYPEALEEARNNGGHVVKSGAEVVLIHEEIAASVDKSSANADEALDWEWKISEGKYIEGEVIVPCQWLSPSSADGKDAPSGDIAVLDYNACRILGLAD